MARTLQSIQDLAEAVKDNQADWHASWDVFI